MRRLTLLALTALLAAAGTASAADPATDQPGSPEITLTLKDHAFEPKQVTVPAKQKIKVTVINNDPTPAEFESEDLEREKIVPANQSISLFLDPMDPGTYEFYDDFHKRTTTGEIIAK